MNRSTQSIRDLRNLGGPRNSHSLSAIAAAFLFLFFLSGPARANTIVFSTGPVTLGGSPVNAVAQFNLDPGNRRMIVTLLNLQNDPTVITSALGSIRFTVSGAGPNPNGSVVAASYANFDISSGPVPVKGTPVADPHSPEPNTWRYTQVSGTQMAFCTDCATGGNNNLILGGPNPLTGRYSNPNGSLISHQPFILGSNASYASGALQNLDSSPSWTIYIPTMTASTTVSKVIFGFGTGSSFGTNFREVDSYTVPTPEPGPLFTVLGGVTLICLGRWRRLRQRQ